MYLRVLGSSDAFNGAGRCHAMYLLEADDPVVDRRRIAIDFGATGLYALHREQISACELDAVLITHLHGDHFGGLPFLLLDGMYNDIRRAPLVIAGPRGLGGRLDTLFEALYVDVSQRPRPFETRLSELIPGDVIDLAGVHVEAFAAAHMDPPEQPLCLRVTLPSGRVVAFSGDTEPCEGLFAAARGADLLVAECTGLQPPCGRHTTWNDWRRLFGEVVARAGVRRVILSHLGADVRAATDVLRAECPPGVELAFADDGARYAI